MRALRAGRGSQRPSHAVCMSSVARGAGAPSRGLRFMLIDGLDDSVASL